MEEANGAQLTNPSDDIDPSGESRSNVLTSGQGKRLEYCFSEPLRPRLTSLPPSGIFLSPDAAAAVAALEWTVELVECRLCRIEAVPAFWRALWKNLGVEEETVSNSLDLDEVGAEAAAAAAARPAGAAGVAAAVA